MLSATRRLIVTAFTATIGFIGVKLETADRITLVVSELRLVAGGYSAGLAYTFFRLPKL